MGRSCWTEEEIADLKAKHPYMSNKELAELFGRTIKAIEYKAHHLGLRKVIITGRVEVNEDFFKKWSPEMAYIFGLIFADGSLSVRPKHKGFSFASKSEDMVKLVREVLESTHKIGRFSKHMNNYMLSVTRGSMMKDLVRLGMKPRQTIDKITEWPKNIPDRYFWHFLRGFFDGNGSIRTVKIEGKLVYARINFTNSNKKFIEDLNAEISRHASFNPKILKLKQSNNYQLNYCRIADCLRLGNLLYQDKGRCFDNRRFQKFQALREQEGG